MAGIFDSLAGLFSGSTANQAAQQQISGLNQGYGLASGNIQQAIQALEQQYGLGQGALSTNYGSGIDAINAGATTANNAINAATNNSTNALTNYYTSALLPFMQNYNQAQQGTTQLGNALGLNGGAAGAQAAAAAYSSNPAYQFQLQQGDQNVLRNSAQTGTTSSGATLNALQQQGQSLANSTYQQYVQNLMPFLSASSTAASGIGSTLTGLGSGLANIYGSQGTNLANIATGTGSQLANLSTGLGNSSANLYTGLGGALAGQYGNLANLGWQFGTGVGNANANATLAQNNGAANLLNFGGNLIGAAAGAFSDSRLKDDIEKVGELYDGSNVYRYRYKWDDPSITRLGLMAQEVEQTKPEAVGDIGGYKTVDYGRATDHASLLAKFQNPTDSGSIANDDAAVDVLAKFLKAA